MAAAFSERLRELREQQGLSQYGMAEKLGMPRSTYAGYESGRREPDLEFVTRVADLFRVRMDWLMGSLQQLSDEIQQDRERGRPFNWRAEIEETLRRAGWSDERVRLALRVIEAAAEEKERES